MREGITASVLWGLPVCQTLSWLWWGSCLGEAILLARVRGEDTETHRAWSSDQTLTLQTQSAEASRTSAPALCEQLSDVRRQHWRRQTGPCAHLNGTQVGYGRRQGEKLGCTLARGERLGKRRAA